MFDDDDKYTLANLLEMVRNGEAITDLSCREKYNWQKRKMPEFNVRLDGFIGAYILNGDTTERNHKRSISIALIDNTNDCSFAVEIYDDTLVDLTKKLMRKGLDAWYEGTKPSFLVDDDIYFTAEEKREMYDWGYAEPAYKLLERYGIEFKEIKLKYSEIGEPLVDEAIAY